MKGATMVVGTGLALFGASTLLAGCGSDSTTPAPPSPSPSTSKTTPAPSPSPSANSSTTTTGSGPAPAPTTTPDPTGRTPLYVALRMDDISVGELEQTQADVLDWFAKNQVPFNFHIITYSEDGNWPTDCVTDPSSSEFCSSPIVQKVQEVYDAGQVVGTGDNAWLSLGCHAHQHDTWPQWTNGENAGATEQHDDLKTSMDILRKSYPSADIRSFAAPANAANNQTVQACLEQGLDIVTTQATVTCVDGKSPPPGSPPGYNYGVGPCGNSGDWTKLSTYAWDCIPQDDTYFTSEGMQKGNGVYSLPCSSANSDFQTVETGLSVDETLGVGQCGCTGNTCTMIGAAQIMADKSNGLHWTVLIMHPQTAWASQSWTEWLDEFIQKARALEEYDVQFVTMQQLTQFRAAHSAQSLFV